MKTLRALFSAFAAVAILFVSPVTLPVAYAADNGSEQMSNKTIDLSGLVLPVERDGKLINYLFVSAIVNIASGYDHWEVREHAHVYRDLILKEAHKAPVGLEGHAMELDVAAFEAIIRKVFDGQLGPGSVDKVEVMAVDSQKIFLEG